MAAIGSRDTKPERVVRRIAHGLGYRFRLHRKDLAGKPDLAFPRLRKAIFVHGCYWHMHACRWGSVTPQTNAEFWQNKRTGNVERDRRHSATLANDGWQVLVVWECETRDEAAIRKALAEFLGDSPPIAPAPGR